MSELCERGDAADFVFVSCSQWVHSTKVCSAGEGFSGKRGRVLAGVDDGDVGSAERLCVLEASNGGSEERRRSQQVSHLVLVVLRSRR